MIPTDGNLVRLLVDRVAESPRQALYVFLNRQGAVESTLSRESLFYAACRLASLLQGRGWRRQAVALYYPHGPAFVIAFWGAVLAGAIPVPLTRAHRSGRSPASGIPLETLSRSGAVAVLTVAGRAAAVASESDLPVITTDNMDPGDGPWTQPDPDPRQAAFIQYTSGSTSSPRGVTITHGNILHNSSVIRQAFGIRADDVGVSWLPFHHDMGLIGHVVQPLYSGIRNVFLAPATFAARPQRWLEAIAAYGGTISGGPDAAFARCCTCLGDSGVAGLDLSRWRLAYCGSEPVRPATLQRFAERFRDAGFDRHALFTCYGLAECTLFVSGRHGLRASGAGAANGTRRVLSMGRPAMDTRLSIVDPETDTLLPEGASGEICVRSPSVAAGYHADDTATVERFGRSRKDRVLRTGDLGFLRDGELYITGRSDNRFQYQGRNLCAEDVEAAVLQSTRRWGIARCASFVVHPELPDSDRTLVIILEHDGTTPWPEVEAFRSEVPGIVSTVTGVLPDDVVLWPRGGVPLTTSGKVRRNHCRERYRIMMAGTV